MKKTDIIIIISTITYSLLFYEQEIGINLTIFNLVLIGGLLFIKPEILKNKIVLFVLLGTVISAVNVTMQNTLLAIILNVFSLITLAGLSINPKGSLLIATLNSMYSFFTSILLKLIEKLEAKNTVNLGFMGKVTFQKVKMVIIPLAVISIFISLYASANPLFQSLIDKINLDFISWQWIQFTAIGFLIMFGFFYQSYIPALSEADELAKNNLTRIRKNKPFSNFIGLKYEYKTGWLLLLLLNILLLVFNGLDINFLLFNEAPVQVQSDYLHQGVNTLITSIILAILVILYYFRRNLNFYKNNKGLRILAYLWVAQNMVLVITTLAKNANYIAHDGLTYKRIGVYVFLFLTFIGLVTTFLKVNKIKSNWFLVRINSILFYCIFVIGTFFNWDGIITAYNLQNNENIDIEYLTSLTDANVPQLVDLVKERSIFFTENQKEAVAFKKTDFLYKMENIDWQSWSYRNWKVAQTLKSTGHE